ncbi:MAG: biotin--[acetyl-CoA-carboxylase] ligase [Bacteroidia bacterium]
MIESAKIVNSFATIRMDTLFIGRKIIELDSVASTNSYATELLHANTPAEGLVIFTKNQTNGKGQRGNKWLSEPLSNLTFSIVLYPHFLKAEQQFILTKTIALGVADFMSDLLLKEGISDEVKIKWPNDIFVGNKKIAGILIENSLRNETISNSVVGIGINLNQTFFGKDAPNAISVKILTNTTQNLNTCLKNIFSNIEKRYLQLRFSKINILEKDFLAKLYKYDEWSFFMIKNEKTKGRITGIAASGKLILEHENLFFAEYALKEIAFIID